MWQAFLAVFFTVFLAEIGDKTQLATLLFADRGESSRWVIFAAYSSAMMLTAGIGVLVGAQLERFVTSGMHKLVAGLGFIAVGFWTLASTQSAGSRTNYSLRFHVEARVDSSIGRIGNWRAMIS